LSDSCSHLNESKSFVAKDHLIVSDGEEESSRPWVAAGSGFAVILLPVGTIIWFVRYCRRSFDSATYGSESDMDTAIESQISSQAIDPFMSEENALNSDARLSGQLTSNNADESFFGETCYS
jgi:hypothetical protein